MEIVRTIHVSPAPLTVAGQAIQLRVDGNHVYRTPGKKPITVEILEKIPGTSTPISFVIRDFASTTQPARRQSTT